MSVTFRNAEIQLSRDIMDFWASTATSDGDGGKTTTVDTELQRHGSGWITKVAYIECVDGDNAGAERKATSLSTHTLTHLAFVYKVVSGVAYRIHRMFTAADKNQALVSACSDAFPWLHERVRDENHRAQNWLKNGSMFRWTETTIPDGWVKSDVTAAENTTAAYYIRGTNSCKLSTTAGYIYQGVTENPDLRDLAGQSITFKIRGHCDKASCLRIAIYDGTDIHFSDFHDGNSAWNNRNTNTLTVTATIAQEPTAVEFRIYHANAAGTSYVDDAQAIGPSRDKIYVGGLGIARDVPVNVFMQHESYQYTEPWTRIRGDIVVDENGWMYLPNTERGWLLRIEGEGFVDFLKAGVSSTDWDATINLSTQGVKILSSQAALWLYKNLIMPNMTTGTAEQYMKGLAYQNQRLEQRKAQFGMNQEAAISNFGAR